LERCLRTGQSAGGLSGLSIAEVKRALELEPFSFSTSPSHERKSRAVIYLFARRYDLALEQARRTYELDPNFVAGY